MRLIVRYVFIVILLTAIVYCISLQDNKGMMKEEVMEVEILEDISVEKGEMIIYYFYHNACASCDGEADIYYVEEKELEESIIDYTIQTYNVFTVEGKMFYENMMINYGLIEKEYDFPLVLINGNVLEGLSVIENRIKEQLLVSSEEVALNIDITYENLLLEENLFVDYEIGELDNTLLYFYRITCTECEAVAETIDNLPVEIELEGVEYQTKLIRLNTRSGKNGNRIYQLFELYNVPVEDQVVPIVFLRDTYLVGAEEINHCLEEYIKRGEGIGMVLQ